MTLKFDVSLLETARMLAAARGQPVSEPFDSPVRKVIAAGGGNAESSMNSLNTMVFVNGIFCGFEKSPFRRFQVDVRKGIRPGGIDEIQGGSGTTGTAGRRRISPPPGGRSPPPGNRR